MTIALHGVSKKYLLKTALDSVTVTFDSAKIHALLGENGAGKSTLAGILCGDITATSGTILIDDKEVSLSSTKEGLAQGIVLVHQRPLLASSISVQENIMLGVHATTAALAELKQRWCPWLTLSTLVKDLGGDGRFYTSLLCALLRTPRFLILDEPSALLDAGQRTELYTNLKTLTHSGCTILIITHSTAEATTYADTVTVLREGRLLTQYPTASDYKAASLATTSKVSAVQTEGSACCISLTHVSCRPKNRPILLDATISVPYHAITMITGMKESALGTLEDVLTGMNNAPCTGTISFSCTKDNDCQTTINLHKKLLTTSFLRARHTAIVPSDRSFRASNPALTVEQILTTYCTGTIHLKAQELIDRAHVNITPLESVSNLSGGMLQRLILAREQSIDPELFILCEPMQGLDTTAQAELCKTLVAIAKNGKAVLVLGATDFPLTLCNKVYSLEGGTTTLAFDMERSNHE